MPTAAARRPRTAVPRPAPARAARTGPAAGQWSQRGSMTLELVLWFPVLVALLTLTVGLGRIVHAHQLLDTAAAAAARSASLSTGPGQAETQARASAQAALADAGVSCTHLGVHVDLSSFHPGGRVTLTLDCTVALADLAMSGLPGSRTLSATSASPVDTYRVTDGTGP